MFRALLVLLSLSLSVPAFCAPKPKPEKPEKKPAEKKPAEKKPADPDPDYKPVVIDERTPTTTKPQ